MTMSVSSIGRTPAPPDDRYLSARTLHEAAAVLRGLATVLEDVPGVWAEDAEHDAQHLRELANALARWWPRPSSHTDSAAEPVAQWDAVLALYLRQGLRPDLPPDDHAPHH
jgi:hypothetical protein